LFGLDEHSLIRLGPSGTLQSDALSGHLRT
jgi:hypothetical protein